VTAWSSLVVAATGEAGVPRLERFEPRTRATVRYADPAAWITATAVANALSESGVLRSASSHEIGMVVVSDDGPAASMAEINAATSSGFSSPLRYAASNPGSLVGVSCIAFGLRGPTINLTMLPADGISVALRLCEGWLNRGVARWMVLATFSVNRLQGKCSRALLLKCQNLTGGVGKPLTQSVADWLVSPGIE
jgi:hypothetical protein